VAVVVVVLILAAQAEQVVAVRVVVVAPQEVLRVLLTQAAEAAGEAVQTQVAALAALAS
jgi:hypothetical protein